MSGENFLRFRMHHGIRLAYKSVAWPLPTRPVNQRRVTGSSLASRSARQSAPPFALRVPMTDPLDRLFDRCRREGVRLVYAAERGSRGYGTHVPTSDWDILAVVAGDARAYASVSPPPQVWTTEYHGNVSTTLFNVPRAALMLVKGKVKLREAAFSACVLHDPDGVGPRMRALAEAWFDERIVRQQYVNHMEHALLSFDPAGERSGRKWLHLLLPLMAERLMSRTHAFPPITLDGLASAGADPVLARAASEALSARRERRDVELPLSDQAEIHMLFETARREVNGVRVRLKADDLDARLVGMANAFAWDVIGVPASTPRDDAPPTLGVPAR